MRYYINQNQHFIFSKFEFNLTLFFLDGPRFPAEQPPPPDELPIPSKIPEIFPPPIEPVLPDLPTEIPEIDPRAPEPNKIDPYPDTSGVLI